MNLFNLSVEQIEKFLIVFVRVISIFAFIPFFGSKVVPPQVKIGFAIMFTLIILPIVGANVHNIPFDLLNLLPIIAGEIIIGILIGFVAKVVFAAIELGGEIVGFQMGFGIVNLIDPQTNRQVPIIGQFQVILATLIFLCINAHHYFINAIVVSFNVVPPSTFHLSNQLMDSLVKMGNQIFLIAIKIAAPIMVTLIIVNVALGIISRTVPQMNIFIIGFPVTISVGLLVIGFSLSMFSFFLQKRIFPVMGDDVISLLKILR